MSNIRKVLIDGQTLIDLWADNNSLNFSSQKNTNIYISISNIMFARYYYSEILKAISINKVEILDDFIDKHTDIESILFNDYMDKFLEEFMYSNKIFSNRIVINKEYNLGIILFKNLNIECEDIKNLSTIIAETLGLIGFFKQRNDNIPFVTTMKEIKEFINIFNIDITYKFININNMPKINQ